MNISDIYNIQTQILYSIQEIRGPFLDSFFIFLNYFDTAPFFLISSFLVWYEYRKKVGVKLIYIFFISFVLGFFLKELFHLPRPFHLHPDLALVHVSGFGFPSGAAQNSVLIAGLLIYYGKKRLFFWLSGLIFAFFLSFSRLYLGVHYPLDILGGWIVGAFLLYTYINIFPLIEKKIEKRPFFEPILFSLAISAALLFYFPYKSPILGFIGLQIGLVVSHYFSLTIKDPTTIKTRIFHLIIGVAVFLPFILLWNNPFVLGFMFPTALPFLVRFLFRKK